MSKRTGYLIWIIVGVLAIAGTVFSLIDASNTNDNFKLLRRILILVIVVVMTISYIVKYVKEGKAVTKDTADRQREEVSTKDQVR